MCLSVKLFLEEGVYFCVDCLSVDAAVLGWKVCICDFDVFGLVDVEFEGVVFYDREVRWGLDGFKFIIVVNVCDESSTFVCVSVCAYGCERWDVWCFVVFVEF